MRAGRRGIVRVPAGTYATGPIRMASGITLYLETGATLRFSCRFEDYEPTFTRWSGYECYGYHPLIYGYQLERVEIKGEGVIDGQGQAWWAAYQRLKQGEKEGISPYRDELIEQNAHLYATMDSTFAEWETQFLRPPLLQLIDCVGVTIQGVTLPNSPFWNTHLVYCDEVKVHGVTFRNPSDTPNGDGLDVDSCTNVTISDCQFDDALFWKPNWIGVPKDEQRKVRNDLVKEEEWIIDGNYGGTMDIRFNAADTIIFLDFPRIICVFRAFKRIIQYRNKIRPDMGEGCEERFSVEFFKWIWEYPKTKRSGILKRLEQLSKDKVVIILKSPKDVKLLLEKVQ